jgi:ABC-type lipoprotein export system ATPase subunit/uncharacterized protein YoxC
VIIERVQVDDGFLDGLDLNLTPGLNVIIGGRGTGKTSVIELIRYCLGITAGKTESGRKALDHALSILRNGRVTVTLRDGDEQIIISRSSNEEMPEVSDAFISPIIFSQTEIESVGLSSRARMSLLDSFENSSKIEITAKEFLASDISSFTAELRSIGLEIEELENQLIQMPGVVTELQSVTELERSLSELSNDMAIKQAELHILSNQVTQLNIQSVIFQRTQKLIDLWLMQLDQTVRIQPDIEAWSDSAGPIDGLTSVRSAVDGVANLINKARSNLAEIRIQLIQDLASTAQQRHEPDNKIRMLRKEIDSMREGAGTLIKKGNFLREKLAGLKATEKLRDAKLLNYKKIYEKRGELLNNYENLFSMRFTSRQSISNFLNGVLGPQIFVSLNQAAEYSDYISVIASALRGSSLKYNELAPLFAKKLSPRELVEAVERNDIDFIANTTGISRDRALRVVSQLREIKLESILTVSVEDDVILQLLDGKDYKDIQNLSVGQRCTVVLPIILEHSDRIVVVDQPEDHLDNAFVVGTLIKAIRQKQSTTQLLFSTHNANIPVLGEAKHVIVMRSDGQRGYISSSGALDAPDIVSAITTIMEGGRDAFVKRARFYAKHT